MSNKPENKEKNVFPVSRRDFIKHSGMAVIGVCVLGCDIGSKKQALGFVLLDMKTGGGKGEVLKQVDLHAAGIALVQNVG